MPHSSTERPFTPPPGYSIVDRRGCFCRPGEPGSLSPVIFVTFESLLSSIPPQLHLLFFEGRDERGKEIAKNIIILPTTRNSNSQSHFSYGFLLCFLFHPPRFFLQLLPHPFIRLFLDISPSITEKVPSSFIPLNFCSTFAKLQSC